MTTFAQLLPVKQLGRHKYSVHFEDEWCVGTVPNGGYVTSAFMIVASNHMRLTHPKRKQQDVINLHLEFMRRTSIGEAVFTVREVKLGSRISNLHLTLAQKNADSADFVDEVEGYLTISAIANEDGPTLESGYRILPEPLPVSLKALSENKDQNYVKRGRDPHGHYRRAGQNMGMHVIRPSKRPLHFPKALVDQWVRFQPKGHRGALTNDALGFVVDIFPQLIEAYVNPDVENAALGEKSTASPNDSTAETTAQPSTQYWYPTLSLNLDVKKLLPSTGVEWLFMRVEAKKIHKGRFDMQVHVLDEAGDLVALSTQSNLVVDSSRNIVRKQKSGATKL